MRFNFTHIQIYPWMSRLGIFCFLGWLLFSCTQPPSPKTPPPTLTGYLAPYQTLTPQPLTVSGASATATPAPTDLPTPTATPYIYAVVANDTLTGIALQHAVSLEDLIAANPELDPNYLTIGLTLTIPVDGVVSAALPTATPIPLVVSAPVCYPLGDGSLQCLAGLENTQTSDVENVIVQLSLQSPAGDELVSQTIVPPLNRLPAGEKTAVSALFAPPVPVNYQANASLLSAIPISPADARYLQTVLHLHDTVITPTGGQATLRGAIEIIPGTAADAEFPPVVRVVWVTALAYDEHQNIIGIRKWVADPEALSIAGINFEFVVYSLGGAIERVDLWVEARP